MKIGYTYISNYGPSLEAQRQKLQQEGCREIFEEKTPALSCKRPEREAALETLQEGDTLVVTRLDRLAASMQDLLAIAQRLQEKGTGLKAVDQPIDTGTPEGYLMFVMIGPLAEFERDIRKARQMDGICKARGKGVAFGRKPILSDAQRLEIVQLHKDGGLSHGQIASLYGVSPITVYRVIKRNTDTAMQETVQETNPQHGNGETAMREGFQAIYSSYG
jgi:DNA invertase Pin-like site-specific DNA recombinase